MVEETFLGVKGVISFTFNMSQRRCSLRVRSDVRPDALCHAVERSGSISAKQVIKNEQGEEVSGGWVHCKGSATLHVCRGSV